MLKKRFSTPAIFTLLLGLANSFLEKYLLQTRVGQWIKMLVECNIDISSIAFYIELLFLAYIEETELLAKFLFLDKLDKL